MPASACPGTVQRYGYLPFLNVTTSFAVIPGWSSGVTLPLILKSCATWPTFWKTNVTLPGFAIDLVESRKKNSPPLTWTVALLPAAEEPELPLAALPPVEGGAVCGWGVDCVFAAPAGGFSE